MSEATDSSGSMPSMPELENSQQIEQQKPRAGQSGMIISLFLCSGCLLIFPTYARLDDLGTGIFYGMGLILLLMGIAVLVSRLAMRARASSVQTAEGRLRMRPARQRSGLNGVLAGVCLLLLGIYFLAFPEVSGLGNLLWLGLVLLFLGITVCYAVVVGRRRAKRLATAFGSVNSQQQLRRSNSIRGGIYIFFLGACFLAFPLGTSLNALSRGIFYGMGLVLVLAAIIGLNSALFNGRTAKQA
ncbi:MAG TPA: hypothetical protein VGD98_21365 [Ktedonobacteraceae bacterium]